MRGALAVATERAREFLLAEAARHFPEVRHVMVFPRAAGFSGASDEQSSDVFARAVLAGVLLDIAELAGSWAGELREIGRAEAEYIADAKLRDRAGGWSYFPGLPELPPDVDSLAAALVLFSRIAPALTALCEEPLEVALSAAKPDGTLETWIVAPRDGEAQRAAMTRGVRLFWGSGGDVEVLAHLCYALSQFDRARYDEFLPRAIRFITSQQRPDGAWTATWYWGPYYGTGLCVRALRECGRSEASDAAITRAAQFLQSARGPDGCWGDGQMAPMDTALAVWALGMAGGLVELARVDQTIDGLARMQASNGSWTGGPWIQMGIGRATGRVTRVATFASATLTTAFCLRSLCLLGGART
jgi:squalene-hopene/tetraprenyl-beta-curcumene cyclase